MDAPPHTPANEEKARAIDLLHNDSFWESLRKMSSQALEQETEREQQDALDRWFQLLDELVEKRDRCDTDYLGPPSPSVSIDPKVQRVKQLESSLLELEYDLSSQEPTIRLDHHWIELIVGLILRRPVLRSSSDQEDEEAHEHTEIVQISEKARRRLFHLFSLAVQVLPSGARWLCDDKETFSALKSQLMQPTCGESSLADGDPILRSNRLSALSSLIELDLDQCIFPTPSVPAPKRCRMDCDVELHTFHSFLLFVCSQLMEESVSIQQAARSLLVKLIVQVELHRSSQLPSLFVTLGDHLTRKPSYGVALIPAVHLSQDLCSLVASDLSRFSLLFSPLINSLIDSLLSRIQDHYTPIDLGTVAAPFPTSSADDRNFVTNFAELVVIAEDLSVVTTLQHDRLCHVLFGQLPRVVMQRKFPSCTDHLWSSLVLIGCSGNSSRAMFFDPIFQQLCDLFFMPSLCLEKEPPSFLQTLTLGSPAMRHAVHRNFIKTFTLSAVKERLGKHAVLHLLSILDSDLSLHSVDLCPSLAEDSLSTLSRIFCDQASFSYVKLITPSILSEMAELFDYQQRQAFVEGRSIILSRSSLLQDFFSIFVQFWRHILTFLDAEQLSEWARRFHSLISQILANADSMAMPWETIDSAIEFMSQLCESLHDRHLISVVLLPKLVDKRLVEQIKPLLSPTCSALPFGGDHQHESPYLINSAIGFFRRLISLESSHLDAASTSQATLLSKPTIVSLFSRMFDLCGNDDESIRLETVRFFTALFDQGGSLSTLSDLVLPIQDSFRSAIRTLKEETDTEVRVQLFTLLKAIWTFSVELFFALACDSVVWSQVSARSPLLEASSFHKQLTEKRRQG